MEKTIARLTHLLDTLPERFSKINFLEWEFRHPNKWSKKEILGHLVDSACNNHQRFLKAQFEELPFKVHPYNQNQLVALNAWQQKPMAELINLWETLNRQILRVIKRIPADQLDNSCDVYDKEGLVTLGWLIEDYVVHMEHHLKQILGPEL